MPEIQKVTNPVKMVTDPVLLKQLQRQGIDRDYVEFFEDYNSRHPEAKFYRDLKSDKQFAVLSALPRVTKDGKRITARWKPSPDGTYHADNNTFFASVDDKRVNVGVGDKTSTWSPQVSLNGNEVVCNPEPTLLRVDPDNPNYSQNVLEWDYGFCKRRLRLIEGAILELYILDHHPDYKEGMVIKGECNRCGKCDLGCHLQNPDLTCAVYDKRAEMGLLDCIKYPDVDDLLANTAMPECSYWIEYQGEKFQPRDVELVIKSNTSGDVRFNRPYCTEGVLQVVGDEKRFSFNWQVNGKPRVWHYPLIIDDTLTQYSTTSDGRVRNHEVDELNYLVIRNAANGNSISADGVNFEVQNTWEGRLTSFYVSRGFLYFDTSALGAGKVISAATLSLNFFAKLEGNSGQSDLHVVEGVQADPFTLADYGNHLTKTTSGGSIAYADITLDVYNDITLNATGRGWISLTGTTKFCLRLAGDKDTSTPTGNNQVTVWAREEGVDYQPKLVVTYTEAPPAPPAVRHIPHCGPRKRPKIEFFPTLKM